MLTAVGPGRGASSLATDDEAADAEASDGEAADVPAVAVACVLAAVVLAPVFLPAGPVVVEDLGAVGRVLRGLPGRGLVSRCV